MLVRSGLIAPEEHRYGYGSFLETGTAFPELLDKNERSCFSNPWLSKSNILVSPASISNALNGPKLLVSRASPRPHVGEHTILTQTPSRYASQ